MCLKDVEADSLFYFAIPITVFLELPAHTPIEKLKHVGYKDVGFLIFHCTLQLKDAPDLVCVGHGIQRLNASLHVALTAAATCLGHVGPHTASPLFLQRSQIAGICQRVVGRHEPSCLDAVQGRPAVITRQSVSPAYTWRATNDNAKQSSMSVCLNRTSSRVSKSLIPSSAKPCNNNSVFSFIGTPIDLMPPQQKQWLHWGLARRQAINRRLITACRLPSEVLRANTGGTRPFVLVLLLRSFENWAKSRTSILRKSLRQGVFGAGFFSSDTSALALPFFTRLRLVCCLAFRLTISGNLLDLGHL